MKPVQLQSQVQGLDSVLYQQIAIDLVDVSILKFKISKSNPFWLDLTIVRGELDLFSYVVALDDAIADLTKELRTSLTLRRIVEFLSPSLNFILKLLQFTGTNITRIVCSF